MDTRQLRPATYKAILDEAGRFHPDLALQFGMLARLSVNEQDYIRKSEELISFMSQYNDADIDAVFLEAPLTTAEFNDALNHISANIKTLQE